MGASILLFVLIGAILGSAAVVLSTKAVLLLAAGLAGTVMVVSSKGAYFALIATMPIYFGFARGITYQFVLLAPPLMVIMARFLIKRGPWPVPIRWPEGWIAFVFFGCTLASTISMEDPVSGILVATGIYGPMAVIFFTTLAFVRDEKDIMHLLWCVLAVGIVEAIASVVVEMYFGFSLSLNQWRASQASQLAGTFKPSDLGFLAGTTWHPYVFGGFLAMVVLIALALALWAHRPEAKWFLASVATLALVVLWFTSARSAIIGLALSLVIVLAVTSKTGRYVTLTFAVTAIAVAIAVMSFHGFSLPLLITELETSVLLGKLGKGGGASITNAWNALLYRFETWGIAWNVFQSHPMLGMGPASTGEAWIPKYLPPWATTWAPLHGTGAHGAAGGTTHNAFLAALAEHGIFAFLTLVGLWVWSVRCLLVAMKNPQYRRYAQLVLAIMAGQFIVVTLNPMYRDIWLTMALATILGRLAESNLAPEHRRLGPLRPKLTRPFYGASAAAHIAVSREEDPTVSR